jgi:hypothetical protein
LIKRNTANAKDIAQLTHFKAVLFQLINHGVNLRYSCWLKIANAFFKMSRSRLATSGDQLSFPSIKQIGVADAEILGN